ncbi:hypothetical protein O4J56_17905 [Nocardiopsis sp. RSe5-2]|uniref:XRE family transcriptional regulator n=1 Tax=Nocardiopsis endophytica TaxID=3018445 RepID=A0ABT4U6F5_9ACTN|nr:hypothetical protein [Nocardiopsis endophytica]MDA2812523.1 hypothetical protein [Nocardiopsis endophytica]
MDAEGNPRLAAAIAESGLSYAALALHVRRVAAENGTEVRTNSAAVAHWVRGTRPKPVTAAYLAEALSRKLGRLVTVTEMDLGSCDGGVLPEPTGDPARDLAVLGRTDVDRRDFITAVAAVSAPHSQRAATARRHGRLGRSWDRTRAEGGLVGHW